MSSLQRADREGKHSCEATGAPLVILVISCAVSAAWDETLFSEKCGKLHLQTSHVLSKFSPGWRILPSLRVDDQFGG